MDVTIVMAELLVTDLDRAEGWWTTLLDRGPDARPMDGLLEWHFPGAGAVQVFLDPARAGRSAVTLGVTDLAAQVARLDAAGLAHEPPVDATAVRLCSLSDPDGNAAVLTEPLT